MRIRSTWLFFCFNADFQGQDRKNASVTQFNKQHTEEQLIFRSIHCEEQISFQQHLNLGALVAKYLDGNMCFKVKHFGEQKLLRTNQNFDQSLMFGVQNAAGDSQRQMLTHISIKSQSMAALQHKIPSFQTFYRGIRIIIRSSLKMTTKNPQKFKKAQLIAIKIKGSNNYKKIVPTNSFLISNHTGLAQQLQFYEHDQQNQTFSEFVKVKNRNSKKPNESSKDHHR
eukprot:403375891